MDKTGGKAKVDKVFKSFKAKLGLVSYAVWSADELRAFLDNHRDVRRAYTAWITPSDVLSDLISYLKRPDLSRLLTLALARDVRKERDVKLKDAGQETDKAIYLEDIFVDLPLLDPSILTMSAIKSTAKYGDFVMSSDRPQKHNALNQLMHRTAEKFNPDTSSLVPEKEHKMEPRGALPNRIVLLGGPGQGKSTLSQFLAQIARARMLNTRGETGVTPETRSIVASILERAASERLWLRGPVRFPVRIDLPTFADSLAQAQGRGDTLSLIAYAASRLSLQVDAVVLVHDLRAWLGTCPSLIILDGLDEVPPTSNRDQVVQAIDSLWDDLHLEGADSLVLVTTRPQGYNNDLDPAYWQHWELAPLNNADVTRYAETLARVRLSDPEERIAILRSLQSAAREPSTSLLLTSPLQVTILFGIAMLTKIIPRDRWDLFYRYYNILFDREARKPGSIVGEYKQQIDNIHYEAGFLLHVSAESAGTANTFFTVDQLKTLIERLLAGEGFSNEKIKTISTELIIGIMFYE